MQSFISRQTQCFVAGALALAIFGIAGCGSAAPSGAVKTFPAEGTLTLDGKPFGPARLTFNPDQANKPHPTGVVDSAGNIVVTSFVMGDGLPAGEYKVFISSDPMVQTPEHPQIYNDPDGTLLTVSVKESGSNDFELDMLSSAGPMTSGPAAPGGVNVPAGADASTGFGPVIAPGATNK